MLLCKSGCSFFDFIERCPDGCPRRLDTDKLIEKWKGIKEEYEYQVKSVTLPEHVLFHLEGRREEMEACIDDFERFLNGPEKDEENG